MCCTGLSGLHYPGTGEINTNTPGTADSALYVGAISLEYKPTVTPSICNLSLEIGSRWSQSYQPHQVSAFGCSGPSPANTQHNDKLSQALNLQLAHVRKPAQRHMCMPCMPMKHRSLGPDANWSLTLHTHPYRHGKQAGRAVQCSHLQAHTPDITARQLRAANREDHISSQACVLCCRSTSREQ